MSEQAPKSQMPSVAQMIQAINKQQEITLAENTRLTQILEIQKKLIEDQRKHLIEVANTAKELLEVEKQRSELKSKLASQKTALLVAAAEAQETSSLVNEILQEAPDAPAISSTESGQIAAKIVDTVAAQVSQLTDECLKSETLTLPEGAMQDSLTVVNQIIQKVMDAGLATESPEDTIRRQSYTISSFVADTEE